MNVCERYEIMISARLDGELDERETAELSAHIAGCERCAALAAAFAAASGALAEEALEEPPAGLHGAIMEKIGAAAKVKRSQTRFMRLRPIIAAAACVAVVVVTLLAANRGLHNAMDTAAGGGTESYAAAPEAPAYADAEGGDGSMAANGAMADTAGVDGAGPMEAPDPAPAPAGAAMDNTAPTETRSVNDAAMSEETVAENRNDLAEPASDADAPAGLPELEVEVVAAGEGSFAATVVTDPSGYFAPGTSVTVLTDEVLSPGTRAAVRCSGISLGAEPGVYYVTAEEIGIIE